MHGLMKVASLDYLNDPKWNELQDELSAAYTNKQEASTELNAARNQKAANGAVAGSLLGAAAGGAAGKLSRLKFGGLAGMGAGVLGGGLAGKAVANKNFELQNYPLHQNLQQAENQFSRALSESEQYDKQKNYIME